MQDEPTIVPVPVKATVSLSDVDKLDIRVGTISQVDDVPGSDKLVRLIVDFGDHERVVLVGMKKERENPREVEGVQALFVLNLAPREMFGHTSQGMLFDIGHADGLLPMLAVPERKVPNGARLG